MHKPIDGTDSAALDEMLRGLRLLRVVDGKSVEELLGHKPDSLEENMRRNGGVLRRKLEGRGKRLKPKRTRKDIAKAARERRERDRTYHKQVAVPRRNDWTVKQIREEGPGGWWDVLRRKSASSWAIKKDWEITKEDFVEAVGNALAGHIVVCLRYNQKTPWTLDNIYIVDTDTRAVLFDGKEHKLRQLGYIV